MNSNIVLIGFMGTGKSAIANCLSKMLPMETVEMDEVIAERARMSISDIFAVYGEEYFRNLETNLLVELQEKSNVIISCGGGTPLRDNNVAEMKKNGRVVLLTAKPETIYERIRNSHDRPLLENNKNISFISKLLEERKAKYEAAADVAETTHVFIIAHDGVALPGGSCHILGNLPVMAQHCYTGVDTAGNINVDRPFVGTLRTRFFKQ